MNQQANFPSGIVEAIFQTCDYSETEALRPFHYVD